MSYTFRAPSEKRRVAGALFHDIPPAGFTNDARGAGPDGPLGLLHPAAGPSATAGTAVPQWFEPGEAISIFGLDAWFGRTRHDPVPYLQFVCPNRSAGWRTLYALAVYRGHGSAPVPLHGGDDLRLPDGQPGSPRTLPPCAGGWQRCGAARYILGIAFAFRLSNWAFSLGHADLHEITKVDILNGMGVGMMVLAVAAVFGWKGRTRFAVAAGLGIAAAAPVIAALSWDGVPTLLYDYLVPAPGQGRFPFFPFAAYVGYGLAAGAIVKRTSEDRLDRLMQWTVLIGLVLALGGEYAGNMSYSVYTKSDFWSNSPALILIRCGLTLLLLAGSYLWTEYCAGPGWSWMIALGKNSLMVYWVHVVLVYGDILKPAKHALSIGQTVTATLTVIVLMVGLSAAWLRWKQRRAERLRRAPSQPQPVPSTY